MPDPKDRQEPETNEPIPTPGSDDTGVPSGNETVPGEETGDLPGDLDDGPLVAMNANQPEQG